MNKKNCIFSFLLTTTVLCLFFSGCGKASEKAKKAGSLKDLNDSAFTIGCMTGIIATQEAQEKLPKALRKEYSMPIDAFTALCAGKVDAVVLDRPTLEYMSLAHPELIVMKEDLAVGHISVAAAKESTKLMEQVNRFIRQYRKDGTYAKMVSRWFHTKNSGMPVIPSAEDGSPVRIGVTANNEPLCFIRDCEFAGFDAEFSLRLGAFLKRKVVFRDMPYDALVAGLESGKIDLAVAFMDAIPEREESVLFSENYVDAPITVLIRKDRYKMKRSASWKIRSIRDLNDPSRIIACETEILAARIAKKKIPAAQYLDLAAPPDCYTALASGKAHAVVYDRPALEHAALARPEFMVLPEDLDTGHISVAAGKDKTELIRKVNEFIRQYRKDGTYRNMYQRWISTAAPEMPEIAKPERTDGKLQIGITADNPPLCSVRDRKPTGFDVEFAFRLGRFLNKEIRFQNFVYDGLVPALISGKIDLAIAQMDATPERCQSVLFSEEYIDSPIAVMIRKKDYSGGISAIPGAETAAEDGGTFADRIAAGLYSLMSSFEKTFLRENRWKLILQGLFTTVVITFFAVIFGTLLAFPVCMMSRSKKPLFSWLADRYVSLIMGTPILVILMILYYVVFAKVDIDGILVAILAFAMDFAAYTSVTLRSGIDGIPRGQTEAALALGHTPAAAFLRFVLPQAVRTILPVYRGEIISTLKATSIVGYIAIMDLTKMGDIIRSRTYEAFFPLIAIAVIYFLAAKCLTSLLIMVENRVDPEYRRIRLQKRGAK